jgi:outer membrane usher protein
MICAVTVWIFSVSAETVLLDTNNSMELAMPMEVIVNGSRSGTWLILKQGTTLFASLNAFEAWRIPVETTTKIIQFKGKDYAALNDVAGYESKVNEADQSIGLLFSPNAFKRTQLGPLSLSNPSTGATLPSLFFNYDLNYQYSQNRDIASFEEVGMLSEIGFSSDLGVLTSSTLGRNMTGNTAQGNASRSLVRLETTYTRDFADRKESLVLGDTVTRPSTMGSSVYFGGVRYGSDYSLAPGFVKQPLALLSGVSLVPSTVSLYVDGVLRQTSNVPTGPFTVDNTPLMTGSGEARLVVRDLLGRETVITRSFLTSNKLLGANLNDWSVEAGRLRQDLGISGGNYGAGFMRGILRHGYNETLTLEGVSQNSIGHQSMGLGVVSVVTKQWLGSASALTSREDTLGTGNQWLLGLQRQGLYRSIFFQLQGASVNFRDLGQSQNLQSAKLQFVASATLANDKYGALGAGLTSTRAFNDLVTHTLALNYSIPVGERSSVNLAASRSQGEVSGTSFRVSLVIPLDNNRMISTSAASGKNQNDFYISALQNPTEKDNFGWRLLSGQQQGSSHAEGGLDYLGRYGNFNAQVSTSKDQNVLRLSESGALVMTEGYVFATQKQNESFAFAHVPDYGDVGIGLGNRILTRTDDSGVALIPHLAAYQRNSVRLDPQNLPVSAEIESLEQIAVPARRSVVKVLFPVRSGRGALIKIQLEDGSIAPAGAIVQIENDSREFYVAHRGEAFVTGLQSVNHLRLKWKTQNCSFTAELPPASPKEITRIGPLTCLGTSR